MLTNAAVRGSMLIAMTLSDCLAAIHRIVREVFSVLAQHFGRYKVHCILEKETKSFVSAMEGAVLLGAPIVDPHPSLGHER
jgi:hypothetical protein